jgi:D-glycerate 3-kinase
MSYGLSMQASLWPSDDPVLSAADYQHRAAAIRPALTALMKQERLNHVLLEPLCRAYLPLAAWMRREKPAGRALLVGVNGAQGAGKSTLTAFVKLILQESFGLRVAALSIDDLYRPHAEREQLAHDVHPLLATRGVPGTHDAEWGVRLLEELRSDAGKPVIIPSFDKSRDDRKPQMEWQIVAQPVDVVILEGWCVGARPQTEPELDQPINELEQREDADGVWRRFVNQQLAGDYARWFAMLDRLVMLKVPDMASVYEWRSLQEDKMAANDARRIMDSSGLKRFIMHYERLTRHMLDEIPERADVVMYLNEHHQFTSIHLNP